MFDVGTPSNLHPWPRQPVEASEDGLPLLNTPTALIPEPTFAGFTLTKFDGTTVTVGAKKTVGATKNTTTTACAVSSESCI